MLKCTTMPFLKKRSRDYPRPRKSSHEHHAHTGTHILSTVQKPVFQVSSQATPDDVVVLSWHADGAKEEKNKDRRHSCHLPMGVTTLHSRVPILSWGDVVRWKMLDGETCDAHRSEGKVWRSINVLSLVPHACFKCRSFPGWHSCMGGFVKLRHKPAIADLPHRHINCGRLVQEQESAKCFGFLELLLFYWYVCAYNTYTYVYRSIHPASEYRT